MISRPLRGAPILTEGGTGLDTKYDGGRRHR